MLGYIARLRAKIGTMKIVVPGVRALIFDGSGGLLLEKQRDFGSWSLPHGCIDVGESAYDALLREVKEETGLDIEGAKPFGLYSDPRYSVTYPNGDEVQTLTVAFLVTKWSGKPVADGLEVSELAFFAFDSLPDPLYAIHADTIEDYRRWDGQFVLR